jgi:hypothetical protein
MPRNLPVRLLADGRVTLTRGMPDPPARWEVLGESWDDDERVCVVRVELAGASWIARVPAAAVADRASVIPARIHRQSPASLPPLQGWLLFC